MITKNSLLMYLSLSILSLNGMKRITAETETTPHKKSKTGKSYAPIISTVIPL
jgi:hypothetical protein